MYIKNMLDQIINKKRKLIFQKGKIIVLLILFWRGMDK